MKRILIVTIAIMFLVSISACGKKETPQEKAQQTPGGEKNPFADFQKSTQAKKEQSEARQGGKIVVADKDTLATVLPDVGGWTRGEPEYNKGSVGSLEIADLQAEYSRGEEIVSVRIQDTGTVSSLLAPLKLAMQMNVSREDSDGYEKVSNLAGMTVIETFHKDTKVAEITFVVKDRYIIILDTESEGGKSILTEFVVKMDFSRLK